MADKLNWEDKVSNGGTTANGRFSAVEANELKTKFDANAEELDEVKTQADASDESITQINVEITSLQEVTMAINEDLIDLADNVLANTDAISQEIIDREASVTTESNLRTSGDQNNADAIIVEQNRAIDAEEILDEKISTETNRALIAEGTIQSDIDKSTSYYKRLTQVNGSPLITDVDSIGQFPKFVSLNGQEYTISSTTSSESLKLVQFDTATGLYTFPRNLLTADIVGVLYSQSGNPAIVPVTVLLRSDVVNNLSQGGATSPLSAEQGKKIFTALPKVIGGLELALPASASGFMRVTNGGVTASASYINYKLDISNYQKPLYVSGAISNTGTALVFYFNSSNVLISYQFQGTASRVAYTKQLLTIPIGTVFLGITILSNDISAHLYTDDIATDLLRKADVVNNLFTGGVDKPLSAEQGKFLANVFPKNKGLQPLPVAQNGFLRVANGTLNTSASYWSYTFELADYTTPIYVSGTIKDAGTALAFYYRADGSLISYQFQGTTLNVTYNQQLLTIPAETTRIGITVLIAGGAAQIWGDVTATDILSKTNADLLYVAKSTAPIEFVLATQMPRNTLPLLDVDYNNINISTPTLTNGDTASGRYINNANKITKSGCTLKKVRVRVSDNTNLIIYCVNVTTVGSVVTVKNLYKYADIAATSAVTEYTISDSFKLPLNSQLAIGDSAGKLYYIGALGSGFRLNATATTGVISSVLVAFNFTTSDSEQDASEIITQNFGDNRYVLNLGGYTGLAIDNLKQVKLLLTSEDKILLYGDSRSSTDYTFYKDAMEDYTGAEVYNGGFSGLTAAQLATDARLQRIWDYDANLMIALIGGNDNGAAGSVGTFGAVLGEPIVQETNINVEYNGTYFIQAISHIMRRFIARYYNIRQRAAGVLPTDDQSQIDAKMAIFNALPRTEISTLIDAVKKPYLIFCTDLPQKRLGNAVASSPASWLRKRDAIVECGNKYKVHIVDLLKELNWDMALEPSFESPTNRFDNYGIYTMDGLHQNKYGSEQMTQIICGQIGII